ncbi:multicopper oxidase family protein [Catenulispora sp. NF23]|uniref:multicopper oxidase family protein n=1 Tax=Catenulispora pinistramenti TaxID=2705254 RepID=UPI001BA70C2B|nr:multicopper oxidase family protein [Catenulispora pinistramenti]MBS2536209.1 multicopper oxidase family protein [Catenulispora pinistramenti]
MSALRLSRRSALRLFGGAGTAAVLAPTLAGCAKPGSDGINPGTLKSSAKLPQPFTVPLPILKALAPDSTDAQGVHYSMTLKQAEVEILPGYQTKIFGYNGTFPGPYLDVHAGTPVVVHQTNQLPVPIVTHLHGGLTPPSDDGFPTDLVFPQALADMANPGMAASMSGMDGMPSMTDPLARMTAVQRDYVFPLNQRAATLWYHDHRMDFTGVQVWRGLFGLCVVRDAEDDKLPLPKGEREIPLMIVDRAFDGDGQLIYPEKDPTLLGKPSMDKSISAGAQGDVVLVNGAPWPYLEVAAVKYRLRILNASNARRYELKLDGPGGGEFIQVGSDGGLLAAPVTHSTLAMAAAERFDVVVDFSKYPVGSTVTLKNAADSGGPGLVMQFRVTSQATDDSSVPATLSTIDKPAVDGAKRKLVFSLQADKWQINGKDFDPAHPLLKPVFGKTEEWTVTSVERHSVHVHGAHFQVTARGTGGAGEYDHGWKDTVELSPGSEVKFAIRFDGYRGRYVAHCHNLEHEDMAMMAAIQVV